MDRQLYFTLDNCLDSTLILSPLKWPETVPRRLIVNNKGALFCLPQSKRGVLRGETDRLRRWARLFPSPMVKALLKPLAVNKGDKERGVSLRARPID